MSVRVTVKILTVLSHVMAKRVQWGATFCRVKRAAASSNCILYVIKESNPDFHTCKIQIPE